MTTFATIPLDKIKVHPDNVRRAAVADDELVESIKAQGILQPVGVVEDGDAYLLIAGHRRHDGAGKANLTSVPAVILDHLVTRGQQIEAMLVENGRRLDLTPMEEAKAYEQLTFEGYKPKDIAKATGRAVATVQSRLRLNGLTDNAQDAIHSQQISLDEAAQLADLEDFPDILAKVEKTIGTNNFAQTLRSVQWDVERERKYQATREGFEAAGLTFIEQPEEGWDWTNGPCPYRGDLEDGVADAYYDGGQYTGPALAVTTKTATEEEAARAAERAAEDSQWEKERAERDALRAARQAASDSRFEHLIKMVSAVKLPPKLTPFVQAGVALASVDESAESLSWFSGVQVERALPSYQRDWDVHATVAAMKPPAVTRLLFAGVFAELDDLVSWHHSEARSAQAALDYIDLLTGSGYVLSDVEVDQVTSIKAQLVELASEPDEESTDA